MLKVLNFAALSKVTICKMKPDLEIVGLGSHANERSCTVHAIFGENVIEGDVLRLVERCTQACRKRCLCGWKIENAIKCVNVEQGVDGCTVAFVRRIYQQQGHVQAHINKFVTVLELYGSSNNICKYSLNNCNFGMAFVVFLNDDTRNK